MSYVVMCLMWLRVLYGYVFYEAMCLIWLLLSVSGLACDYRMGLSGVILAIGKGGGRHMSVRICILASRRFDIHKVID